MKINPNLDSIYQNIVKQKSALQSQWIKWYDSLTCKPLPYYMTPQDVAYLNKIAMSPALNCNVKEKYHLMDELMLDRGFKLCGGGTNRRAYQHVVDTGTLVKIATDNVGFTSNTRELINQHVIKPFCSKMFDTTPCGTVGLMECVVPIKTIVEYQKYAEAIHDMLFFVIRNNDIGMEDIGTRSFKNIGFRNDFGPVFLDYPTMYLLDPNRRFCRAIINGVMCCGTLDYDEGYNTIVCTECGRTYFAKSLARKNGEDINLLLRAVGRGPQRKESCKMNIKIVDVATGNVEREIRVTDKSGFIDPSRRHRLVDLNNPNAANPKPVKTPKVKFVDVPNPTTEQKVETTVTVQEFGTPDKNMNAFEAPSEPESEETLVACDELKPNAVIESSRNSLHPHITIEELATAYNEALSGFKTFELNTLTTAEIWEKVHAMFSSKLVPTKDRVECQNMYNQLKIATADPISGAYLIDSLILSVFPAQSRDALFDAFYKIVNTIKNAADLFEAIITYNRVVLDLYSFETDETVSEVEYKIYVDIYNVYLDAIRVLVKDFFANVAFSGYLTYNANNIISIIGRYMTNLVNTANNEMGELNIHTYYVINTSNYAPYVSIVIKNDEAESDEIEERSEPLEEITSDNVDEEKVQDPEKESAEESSTDDDFDLSGDTFDVIPIDTANVPTENRMNRKQENRWGNGKKGKNGKRRRH